MADEERPQLATRGEIRGGFWRESISREEARRRLASRGIADEGRRARIEAAIPETTDHIMSFSGGWLREYVTFDNQPLSFLLLLMPYEERDGWYELAVPLAGEDPHAPGRILYGVDLHRFKKGPLGELMQEGKTKDSFNWVDESIVLTIDARFMYPEGALEAHPGGTLCCDACEWVHSTFEFLHCVDSWCCLGTC
jgi:hypothetical protein